MITFTITGLRNFENIIDVGDKVILEKNTDNKFDIEAINVLNEDLKTIGFVANSVKTVQYNTHSAGYLSLFISKYNTAIILSIDSKTMIAELEENIILSKAINEIKELIQ